MEMSEVVFQAQLGLFIAGCCIVILMVFLWLK